VNFFADRAFSPLFSVRDFTLCGLLQSSLNTLQILNFVGAFECS
jgi:hypothetical protein